MGAGGVNDLTSMESVEVENVWFTAQVKWSLTSFIQAEPPHLFCRTAQCPQRNCSTFKENQYFSMWSSPTIRPWPSLMYFKKLNTFGGFPPFFTRKTIFRLPVCFPFEVNQSNCCFFPFENGSTQNNSPPFPIGAHFFFFFFFIIIFFFFFFFFKSRPIFKKEANQFDCFTPDENGLYMYSRPALFKRYDKSISFLIQFKT